MTTQLDAEIDEAEAVLNDAIATGSAEQFESSFTHWEALLDKRSANYPRSAAKAPASPQADPRLGPMREQLERVRAEFDAIPADDQTRPAKARQLQILAGAIEEAEASLPYMNMSTEELEEATTKARLRGEQLGVDLVALRERFGPDSEHVAQAEKELADLRLEPARLAAEAKRRARELQLRQAFETQSKIDASQEVGTADHLFLADWRKQHRGSEDEFEGMKLERDLEASRPKRIEERAAALLAEKLGRLGRAS